MTETAKLAIPTVHRNGTGKDGLLEPLKDTYSALTDVLGLLSQTAPNARDYYVQEAGAFKKARSEHEDRCNRIADVQTEIMYLATAIDDQGS